MTSKQFTPEEIYEIQKDFDIIHKRVSNAFLSKIAEMVLSREPIIGREYITILEKEATNLRHLMSSHLSLITNAQKIKDGEAPISYRSSY